MLLHCPLTLHPWRATSNVPSFASYFTQHPYLPPVGAPLDITSSQNISLYMPRFDNSADSPHPCHNGCFAWTSTALQASSVRMYYRSDTNTSGTRIPYGLYNSLSTLRISCSSDCVLTQESISNLRLRVTRKTRYGWPTMPYPTGTFTQQDAPSFACRTNIANTGRMKMADFFCALCKKGDSFILSHCGLPCYVTFDQPPRILNC